MLDATPPSAPITAAARRGIYLGTTSDGWAWTGPDRSTLVLGPSRSGKTSSLVIPNVLGAGGPVVSTSTKPDVLLATAPARARSGWALLYDPSGTVEAPPGVERVGWSPVNASEHWDGALLTAESMVWAGRRDAAGREAGASDHWTERAAALLAPLLHAAALDGRSMAQVLSWVERHDGSAALDVLADRTATSGQAADVLAGIVSTDQREQSGIWSTTSGVLSAYRSSTALASTEAPFLDAARFCAGSDTLDVCAPGRRQQHVAPLVVGLLSELRDAAYHRAASAGRSVPMLMALDEVANIAPIPDLPALVSEGAGQGVLTLACLQDLSQARWRWGARAEGFVSLFGTTVVLGGIADVSTLQALSTLAGDEEVPSRTVGTSRGPDGRLRPSLSVSATTRRRLAADEIARGRRGQALVIDARNRLAWVALTPAHAVARSVQPDPPGPRQPAARSPEGSHRRRRPAPGDGRAR